MLLVALNYRFHSMCVCVCVYTVISAYTIGKEACSFYAKN